MNDSRNKVEKKVVYVDEQSVVQETKKENNEPIENNNVPKKVLVDCQKEAAEWKDKFVRLNADFENFKKRILEQQKLWTGTAQAEIFFELLVIVDDFERALSEHEKQENALKNRSLIEGFELIYQSFTVLLKKFGVEEITKHDLFNPVYHEALVRVDSPDHESGTVVAVMQKRLSV